MNAHFQISTCPHCAVCSVPDPPPRGFVVTLPSRERLHLLKAPLRYLPSLPPCGFIFSCFAQSTAAHIRSSYYFEDFSPRSFFYFARSLFSLTGFCRSFPDILLLSKLLHNWRPFVPRRSAFQSPPFFTTVVPPFFRHSRYNEERYL
jgi:hypothetical protein